MPKENKPIYKCNHCRQTFETPLAFYRTNSRIYSKDGFMPICKECVGIHFNSYLETYRDSKKALQRICMAFDLYFSEAIYKKCSENTNTMMGNYIKRLNMIQYKNKTFDTSLEEGFVFGDPVIPEPIIIKVPVEPENPPEPEKEVEEISQEDIDKWGECFDATDYNILNTHYKLLKDANPTGDSNQEIFITDLCYIKMQQMKAVREGRVDDYNKLTESYRKSFTQAGLKTVRDTSINEEFTIGVNAEIIEKYTPSEYYKNKELYRDFDKIGEYFQRMVLRPLRNLMHGSNDRDIEYYVKEEVDEDVYSDE